MHYASSSIWLILIQRLTPNTTQYRIQTADAVELHQLLLAKYVRPSVQWLFIPPPNPKLQENATKRCEVGMTLRNEEQNEKSQDSPHPRT